MDPTVITDLIIPSSQGLQHLQYGQHLEVFLTIVNSPLLTKISISQLTSPILIAVVVVQAPVLHAHVVRQGFALITMIESTF